MPVVMNGRRISLAAPGTVLSCGTKSKPQPHVSVVCKEKRVEVKGHRGDATLINDITLIQEHFGCLTISEAGRIAFHLTANAIRANRALPEVNND
jgi:hypothetical protein